VRLLVVDDNPVNQKLLFYSLKKHYDVVMANNGLEAVQKLNNEAFDAVLMDLSMPVMDGAEATLQIGSLMIPEFKIFQSFSLRQTTMTMNANVV